MYDTIIIGAGMSGLAAGIRLAHFGQKVCILERHSAIGGLNSFYRQRGRTYDVGLHAAIASRIAATIRQMGGREVFFAGGGAQNLGVRAALEAALGHRVYVPPEPQFVVATGAALIAAGIR